MARLYVVALPDPDSAYEVHHQLSEAYDSNNILWAVGDSMLLVRSSSDCEAIADDAGLNEDRPGVVFRLTSDYAGYMPKDFWEWLRE